MNYENSNVTEEQLRGQVLAANLMLSTTPEVTQSAWQRHLRSAIGPELTYLLARCFQEKPHSSYFELGSYFEPAGRKSMIREAAISIGFSRANEATKGLLSLVIANPVAYTSLTGVAEPEFYLLMEEFWLIRGMRIMPMPMSPLVLEGDSVEGNPTPASMVMGDSLLYWGTQAASDKDEGENWGKLVKVTLGVKIVPSGTFNRLHFQIIKPPKVEQ